MRTKLLKFSYLTGILIFLGQIVGAVLLLYVFLFPPTPGAWFDLRIDIIKSDWIGEVIFVSILRFLQIALGYNTELIIGSLLSFIAVAIYYWSFGYIGKKRGIFIFCLGTYLIIGTALLSAIARSFIFGRVSGDPLLLWNPPIYVSELVVLINLVGELLFAFGLMRLRSFFGRISLAAGGLLSIIALIGIVAIRGQFLGQIFYWQSFFRFPDYASFPLDIVVAIFLQPIVSFFLLRILRRFIAEEKTAQLVIG